MKIYGEENLPRVSIICLTYNHERYIKDALDGFLMQKVDFNYEIIIHDDASTDGTQGIIREYQKKYPRIIKTILQAENQKSTGGNVFGNAYALAKGKYIACCEGDDYWVDDLKLQIQIDFLEKNKQYVIAYADCEPLFEGDIPPRKIVATSRDLSSLELMKAPPIHTLTVCFRRVINIPTEYGFVEYGDLFLWALLGQHGGGKYLNCFKPCRYRVHRGGIHSSQTRHRQYEMVVLTYALMARYFRRIGAERLSIQYRSKIISETIKYLLKAIPGFLIVARTLKLALNRIN